MARRHEGKVFVVTGAARGIGQSLALRLAIEGAKVVGIDLLELTDTVSKIDAIDGSFLGIVADVTSEADLAEAHKKASENLGPVDGIVNVAGILSPMPWNDMDYQFWKKIQTVNVDSVYLTCREFVPDLQAKKAGSIVNFSSGIFWGAAPGCVAYRTSKAAIIGLSRGLAVDLGPDNSRANAVTPSFVMTEGARPHYAGLEDVITAGQLLKRPARPLDTDGLVSFLLSDDADFITGQMLHADGGLVMN
jgi:NAD(P)-dependent dehydrogenase (short-subunit alcohol dehydrogenase family)